MDTLKPDPQNGNPSGSAFSAYCTGFMLAGLIALLVAIMWGMANNIHDLQEVNYFFTAIPLAYTAALVIPLSISLIRRDSGRVCASSVGGACFGLLVPAVVYGLFCFIVIVPRYQNAPDVAQFVAQDFDGLAVNGEVTETQLFDIHVAQLDIKEAVARLDAAQRELDATAKRLNQLEAQNHVKLLDDTMLAQAASRLSDAKQKLTEKLLPAGQAHRINATIDMVCYVGRPLPEHNCAATKEQLLSLRSKVEQDFPTWLPLLRRLPPPEDRAEQ